MERRLNSEETEELLIELGLSKPVAELWAGILTKFDDFIGDYRKPTEAEVRDLPRKLAAAKEARRIERENTPRLNLREYNL